MSTRRLIPLRLLVAALTFVAAPLGAQTSRLYLGGARGGVRLMPPGPAFGRTSPPVTAVALGYLAPSGVGGEVRVSRLHVVVTEAVSDARFPEAPYTIGLRATIVEASLGYRPSALRLGLLQPVASAGVLVALVVDSYESDTPEEQLRSYSTGLSAATGVEARLGGRVTLTGRGSYQHLRASSTRPARAVGLSGLAWEIGIRVYR